jgi:hypothetical protein
VLHRTAADVGREFERELVTEELRVLYRHAAPADLHGSGDHLKLLLERDLIVDRLAAKAELRLPRACNFRGNDPEEEVAATAGAAILARGVELFVVLGFPVFHAEIVRDDARAGLQLEELRPEREVHPRQQIHGDHARLGEIGLEEVALVERNLVRDPCAARVLLGLRDTRGVEIDAEPARAVLGRRRDDDASIARAQVDEIVLRPDFGDRQHAVDDVLRRRHVRHARIGGVCRSDRRGQRERRARQRATAGAQRLNLLRLRQGALQDWG